jgi:hypothetical protein
MREMLVTFKKAERDERDARKREQKEAVDRAKVEEEKREATRQARKLEFLISQTELYSHFVGSKLKSEQGGVDAVVVLADGAAQPPRLRAKRPVRKLPPAPTMSMSTAQSWRISTSTMVSRLALRRRLRSSFLS